jgi:hypothetical protein
MSDREQELKDVPHRPADQSTWPKGIRTISIEEAGALELVRRANFIGTANPSKFGGHLI